MNHVSAFLDAFETFRDECRRRKDCSELETVLLWHGYIAETVAYHNKSEEK